MLNKIRQDALWQREERLLLAVSGGVDSMVLLALFQRLPRTERPFFAVAHVNHQLRPAATGEATYLANYCAEQGIPFHLHRWEDPQPEGGNLEARAREMRYAFFTKVCQEHAYNGVVTAHHGDDQGETFLLKLLRGTQLKDLVGMRPLSERAHLRIYRPFLALTKHDLYAYAQAHQLVYFEDETNASPAYQRNRVRHEIMPKLQAENANFLQHIHNLVKQIEYANSIVAEVTAPLLASMVVELGPDAWRIDLDQFNDVKESHQYMLLVAFFQEALIEASVPLQEQHVQAALSLLTGDKAHGRLSLPERWELVKSYDWAYLRLGETVVSGAACPAPTFQLTPGQGVFVSDHEWFGLAALDEELLLPPSVATWQRTEFELTQAISDFPLTIRRGDPKERIVINQAGQRKELRRVLIDQKVPHDLREQVWVVTNPHDLLWIVPIRKSYLSIRKETDKIHYRLIYLKARLDLGGDRYARERH